MATGKKKSASKKSSTRKKTPAKTSSAKKKATSASSKKKVDKKSASTRTAGKKGAAKKTTANKTTSKGAGVKKTAAKKTAAKAKKVVSRRKTVSPGLSTDERWRMIAEAAYLRELFDEPTTMLYQVWALIRTIDESYQAGSEFEIETILSQADELVLAVVNTLEGAEETEIVRLLLRFKNLLTQDADRGELSPQASATRAEVINVVNNFFYEKLTAVPAIRDYIEDIQEEKAQ